jgi:3-oxoacyl-[acyl-carrier-protein] synthase II
VKRVVVTGVGVITPLGSDVQTFFASLLAAKSAIRHHDFTWGRALAAPLQADVDSPFPKIRRLSLDRVTQIALLAVRQAMQQSGQVLDADNSEQAGIYWSTGMGGANTLENAYRDLLINQAPRLRPNTIVAAMNNAATGQIGIEFGIRGPSYTYSSACSSSAVAIGEAFRAIRFGLVRTAIAGGAEALLTEGVVKAWESLQTLAKPDPESPQTSCRPFAADRSGFVLGEGAAALVLEEEESARARGATIVAEIVGYGNTTDASHITQPEAGGQARAIRMAIEQAAIAPEEIQYINAHGTGTRAGDSSETLAIKHVFGQHARAIPVSATKALHGHLMGATGAVEFVAALESLRTRTIPPTAHLFTPDPECDLDYVSEGARKLEALDVVMSNSFGFGGNNAVLIARRYSPNSGR